MAHNECDLTASDSTADAAKAQRKRSGGATPQEAKRAMRRAEAAGPTTTPACSHSSSCEETPFTGGGGTTTASRLYLGCISATPRLYLGHVSRAWLGAEIRLSLGCLSAICLVGGGDAAESARCLRPAHLFTAASCERRLLAEADCSKAITMSVAAACATGTCSQPATVKTPRP